MNEHTPGPWRVGTSGPNGCPAIGTTKGLMVAMIAHSLNVPDQKVAAESDAALIAAAPELLEALLIAKDIINRYANNNKRIAGYSNIEDAITKAKGESK